MELTRLIEKMLSAKRIAAVGVSDDPSKPSHAVAKYLMDAGYEVLPINPNLTTVLGFRCYASLKETPGLIDLVNVFRRPEFIPGIVSEAIEIHAGGVWVQSGIRSLAGGLLAETAGLDYLQDRCIMVEHARRQR